MLILGTIVEVDVLMLLSVVEDDDPMSIVEDDRRALGLGEIVVMVRRC